MVPKNYVTVDSRLFTWLLVDCPHIQLKGADTETPQHLRVHHLERKEQQRQITTLKVRGNVKTQLPKNQMKLTMGAQT